MAIVKEMPYSTALVAVETPKYWVSGFEIVWIKNKTKHFPQAQSFRIALSFDAGGLVQSGLFVTGYYKQEVIPGLRDKLSLSLIADNCRLVALDDNGLGMHTNKVGAGMPYFRQDIGFPHLHFPVMDSNSDYAEPITPTDPANLWIIFLDRANILNAPTFNLPTQEQLRLL